MVDEHDVGDHLVRDAQSEEKEGNSGIGMKDNNHIGRVKDKVQQKGTPRIAQQYPLVLIASANLCISRKAAKPKPIPHNLRIDPLWAQASIPYTINRIEGGHGNPPSSDEEDSKRKCRMWDADCVAQEPKQRRDLQGEDKGPRSSTAPRAKLC